MNLPQLVAQECINDWGSGWRSNRLLLEYHLLCYAGSS
jgi:hypothetical protein